MDIHDGLPEDGIIKILGVTLTQTGYACPEQYDATLDGEQIAYFRLRHGRFTVSVPDVGGQLVFEAYPRGDGSFELDERMMYLTAAVRSVLRYLGKFPHTKKTTVKQVILMLDNLGMTKGKMVAQGAHASLAALFGLELVGGSADEMVIDLSNVNVRHWVRNEFTKVCVRISSEEELKKIVDEAKRIGMPVALITDNGRTMFKGVQTVTCGAIGPFDADVINSLTGHLKLF